MQKLIVRQHRRDYGGFDGGQIYWSCHPEGSPNLIGTGDNIDEAIGAMVRHAPREFGFSGVEWSQQTFNSERNSNEK